VWQAKDFKSNEFGCVARKGVIGAIFGCVANAGVRIRRILDAGKDRELPPTPPGICKDVKGKELREGAFVSV
jgi:hypothetical protein